MIPISNTAKAVPAVPEVGTLVPVVADTVPAVVGLLEALGVIEAVSDVAWMIGQGFDYLAGLIDAIDPYIITIDEVVGFFKKFFPSDTYYTDGEDYYISTSEGFRSVGGDDVYINVDQFVDADWVIPINAIGVRPTAYRTYNLSDTAVELGIDFMEHPRDYYAVSLLKLYLNNAPSMKYYTVGEIAFTYSGGQEFDRYYWYDMPEPQPIDSLKFTSNYTHNGKEVWMYSNYLGTGTDMVSEYWSWKPATQGSYISITDQFYRGDISDFSGNYYYARHRYSVNDLKKTSSNTGFGTFLITKGPPTMSLPDYYPNLQLPENSAELDGSIVNVPQTPQGTTSTEYAPLPPEFWEIFQSLADAQGHAAGQNTNNNTTFGDYVNNNFEYNISNDTDIDIEFPSEFKIELLGRLEVDLDADVNLSGDLDIDIDININENVSIPEITADDGGLWDDLNVQDAIADMTIHNPVFPTIRALLESIDPKIRAIFISAVGLTILLGVWKMIRGWR